MLRDLKKFKGAPFGTQRNRFDVSGVHPGFKIKGSLSHAGPSDEFYSKTSTLGPGYYEDSSSCFSELSMMKKAKASPGWARAIFVETQSKLPPILYKEEWLQKQLQERSRGPGTYNPKDFINILAAKPTSVRGICHSSDNRFKSSTQNIPGPGTYEPGKTLFEDRNKKSYGVVGIIDARIPRKETKFNRNPGPGTYEIKSGIDSLLQKVVGNRGPYELFTGPRTLNLQTTKKVYPCPGQYEIKSGIDQVLESSKNLQGKFGKCERWIKQMHERIASVTPKDLNIPGPGHYDVSYQDHKSMSRNLPPFASSATRSSQPCPNSVAGTKTVAPDRYDILLWQEKQPVNGHRSVFLSKTKNISGKQEKMLRKRLHNSVNEVPDDVIRHNTSQGVKAAMNVK
ncbi:lymphocyte expansion molecule-like isoform X2 [Octopus sinensis]|uniref:Lymphocyte expansion molecule-like isoform X2 n=1 Tax=Octopus sinensis TaxID=2607531 RepID=A0A7E6FM48_9MOLL|nr:lymphocyte expansion molecule-like isoform X2 [Octopus sinensis]